MHDYCLDSMLLKVVFQYQEIKADRVRPVNPDKFTFLDDDTRRRVVSEQAVDRGGLMKHWLNDYFDAMKSYFVLLSCKPFILFESEGTYFLPSRLVNEDGGAISLDDDDESLVEVKRATRPWAKCSTIPSATAWVFRATLLVRSCYIFSSATSSTKC